MHENFKTNKRRKKFSSAQRSRILWILRMSTGNELFFIVTWKSTKTSKLVLPIQIRSENSSVGEILNRVILSRRILKPIHWVKSFAQWYVFKRMNSWCQLWQVGKVWWEWYVFQRMKIVQNCLLNEWILAPIFNEFCIFIASKTQHSIPSPIVWPTSTETDLTVPGMGAIITLSTFIFGFSFMNFLNFTTCWGTKATSKAVPLYLIRKISSKVLLISWTVSVPWSVSILQTLSHCEKPPKEKNQV